MLWHQALRILCPHFREERDHQTGEEREVLSSARTGYAYDISQAGIAPLAPAIWQEVAGDLWPD